MFLDDLLPKLTDFLSAKLDETGADTFVVGISAVRAHGDPYLRAHHA